MCIVFFCRFFFCQCLSLDFFVSATVHTTLLLTSSFLISLAVQFLCVSRFCFCVLSGAVYVYVYAYVCICVCVCVCVLVCVYVYVCLYVYMCICVFVCVVCVCGKMVNAP